MKIIYILSAGHSGSTLLDLILDSHSEIFGAGEIGNAFKKTGCACGNALKNCSFWQTIFKKDIYPLKIYQKKLDFILNSNRYCIKERKDGSWRKTTDVSNYISSYTNLYQKILNQSGKEIIVDSSKKTERVKILSENKKIEPIVIHLARDGRAVTWSYMRKYNQPWRGMWHWFANNIKIEILKRRKNFPTVIFVNYEKLTRFPEKTVKDILSQIKLNYESPMLKFGNFIHHQAGGNRMRFSKTSEIKEDTEWQEKMPKRYKFLFTLFFGWLNWYYKK